MATGRSVAIKSLYISLVLLSVILFTCAFVDVEEAPNAIQIVLGFVLMTAGLYQLIHMFYIARLSRQHQAGCGCVIVFVGSFFVPLLFPIFALTILVRSGKVLREAGYTIGVFYTDMDQFPDPSSGFPNRNNDTHTLQNDD